MSPEHSPEPFFKIEVFPDKGLMDAHHLAWELRRLAARVWTMGHARHAEGPIYGRSGEVAGKYVLWAPEGWRVDSPTPGDAPRGEDHLTKCVNALQGLNPEGVRPCLDALRKVTEHLVGVMGGPRIQGAGVTFEHGVEGIPTIKEARTALALLEGKE